MLEPRSHERRDRRHDHHNFVGDRSGAERHPDGETDEHVAEHGQKEQLHRRKRRLRLGERQSGPSHGAASEGVVGGQQHDARRCHGSDDVADVDQHPRPDQLAE